MIIGKQQLLNQQNPQFQHSEGTCLCGVCLCGNCLCKPQPIKQSYHNKLKSVYETDFQLRYSVLPKARPIIIEEPKRRRAFSQNSVYDEDFTPKQISQGHTDEKQHLPQLKIPFAGCNSYALQYPNKFTDPPQQLRPVNQIQLLPAKMDNISQYQREYKLRQNQREHEFSNFSKIMNKRLHINSKDKLVYSNSSYQEQFKPRQSIPLIKLPIQQSSLPFGISNIGINPFVSQSKFEFASKSQDQCEANRRILEICSKS
ncbi:unnamed protein product [Paramecium pentaurelia]|uniref:Uncharacterized protein n=1 Tax=Paramecium pentaurelia TaxID=43138 RepID=A0A8S1V5C3_9CILI|nr:unnamed protein product [Paramecium pentaurelia]